MDKLKSIPDNGSFQDGWKSMLRQVKIQNGRLASIAQNPKAPILGDDDAIEFYEQTHGKGKQAKKVKSGVKPL